MKLNRSQAETRKERVEAILSGRRVLLEDGTLATGYARPGSRVLVSRGGVIEGSPAIIAGGPQRKQTFVEHPVFGEAKRPFRLLLDGGDWERPYSGWLGRLLVFEMGNPPRLYAIPQNKRYSGYATFGCALRFGEEFCAANAICRNTYGQAPCEAPVYTENEEHHTRPLGFSCGKTWATCKDRDNFAGCPLRFGEPPCYADGTGESCEYSVRTCKALTVDRDDFGESQYAGYGGCKNTLATCQHTASFLPYAPELHVFSEDRDSQPFEPSLVAFDDGYFVWLAESQKDQDYGGETKRLSLLWLARTTDGVHLPADVPMGWIPSVPCGTMIHWMGSNPEYTGIGVADADYSIGSSGQHYIVTVQWVLSDEAAEEPPSAMVVNTSPDGEDWSADGLIARRDSYDAAENPQAPTYPSSFAKTEHRVGKMIEGAFGLQADGNTIPQNQAKTLYHLKGHIRGHCWETEAGDWRREYDEMWIRLMANNAECTFDPPIIFDGYIPDWPATPDGFIIDPQSWPEGALISQFWFRFGAGGWPTGTYEVWVEGGYLHLLMPVTLILGYRTDAATGLLACVKVAVLLHYKSGDGVNFTDGAIVTDADGHYMTCQHSIPVCEHWDAAAGICTEPNGFCGHKVNGYYQPYYPNCDGQGTAAWPGTQTWQRYEPSGSWRGPGKHGRGHIKGYPPGYALAGCGQQATFACRYRKEGYEGQWCARADCPAFDPRALWGAAGVNVMDTLKNTNL